jgi:hypothetical protein
MFYGKNSCCILKKRSDSSPPAVVRIDFFWCGNAATGRIPTPEKIWTEPPEVARSMLLRRYEEETYE